LDQRNRDIRMIPAKMEDEGGAGFRSALLSPNPLKIST
jgi:hypothetical protein